MFSTKKQLLKLMRLDQWIKNIFIFLPVFFAGKIFSHSHINDSIIAFFVFSFTASIVYVVNDLFDVEKDKLHPEKKNRPLPSGKISKNTAIVFLLVLFTTTTVSAVFFLNLKVLILISFYLIMNLGYSFGLKSVSILDINIIAVGFLIRVLVGGYAAEVPVSKWAILLTYMLALILAVGKRRGEIISLKSQNKTRKVLESYNVEMLNVCLGVVSAITIVCYIMYTVSAEVNIVFPKGKNYVYLSSIFVIMGILRYLQQSFVFNSTESPTKFLYKDTFLQIIIISWVLFFTIIIYIQ